MANEPDERRRGSLKNGNPSGDWSKAPRCGALTRRQTACQCPAMRNRRRCRLHGGKSAGPRTAAGLERSRRARWKHGAYSREARETLAESRGLWRNLLATLGSAK
jgi:glucans biosynthesis protein